MEEIKQFPTKKRIEFLRNVEDAGIKELVRQIDACTDKKTLQKIDRDEYEIAPNLHGMKDQGGMDLFWTVSDLRRQKETALNKIEKEAKLAAKKQKDTTKKQKEAQRKATIVRYQNLPELKGVLDELGTQFYNETVTNITVDYAKSITAYFTDKKFNLERPSSSEYYKYRAYCNVREKMAPFMIKDELKPNWAAIVKKIANESAKIWVDEFKAKMALKLGGIIDFKGGAEVKRFGNVADYILLLSFKDTSSFFIKTKQVWSRSCNGVEFFRFPSTFHNVIFADGTKMKTPSAEKMLKEFGVDIKKKED